MSVKPRAWRWPASRREGFAAVNEENDKKMGCIDKSVSSTQKLCSLCLAFARATEAVTFKSSMRICHR
jgi:hypothetical protein